MTTPTSKEDLRFLQDIQSWPFDGRPLSLARDREQGRRLEKLGLVKLRLKSTSTRFPMTVARLTPAGLAALEG